jgi:hypothetical protein
MRKYPIVAALVLAGLAWSQIDALRLIRLAARPALLKGPVLSERLTTYGQLTLPEAAGVIGHIDEVSTVVRGWALGSDGQLPILVFLVNDAGQISSKSAEVILRPDVATALGNSKAKASGYQTSIPAENQCSYQLGVVFDDLTITKIKLPSCLR